MKGFFFLKFALSYQALDADLLKKSQNKVFELTYRREILGQLFEGIQQQIIHLLFWNRIISKALILKHLQVLRLLDQHE